MEMVEKNTLPNCPIAQFSKAVLTWDYFQLIEESSKGDYVGAKVERKRHKNVEDYMPILFEEAVARIIRGKDDRSLMQQEMAMVGHYTELRGFIYASVLYLERPHSFSRDDLLLVTNSQFMLGANKLPRTYAFAIRDSCQRHEYRLKMFLPKEVQEVDSAGINSAQRLVDMRSYITRKVCTLFISKVCSLSDILEQICDLRAICALRSRDWSHFTRSPGHPIKIDIPPWLELMEGNNSAFKQQLTMPDASDGDGGQDVDGQQDASSHWCIRGCSQQRST